MLPNALSLLRILLSVGLFWTAPLSIWFWILYGICGVSDVLDGWLARRWDAVTHTGQLLDSVGDVGFFLAILICFFPQWQSWTQYWVLAILFIRVFALLLSVCRFQIVPFLHTVLNKITGLLLFLFPVLYGLFGFSVPAVGVCFAASLAALEEVGILCVQKRLTEIAGLFWQSGPEKNGVIPFTEKNHVQTHCRAECCGSKN